MGYPRANGIPEEDMQMLKGHLNLYFKDDEGPSEIVATSQEKIPAAYLTEYDGRTTCHLG